MRIILYIHIQRAHLSVIRVLLYGNAAREYVSEPAQCTKSDRDARGRLATESSYNVIRSATGVKTAHNTFIVAINYYFYNNV